MRHSILKQAIRIIFFVLFELGFGYKTQAQTIQNTRENLLTICDSLRIQYIDLKHNKILFEEISKYIIEQSDSSELFRNGFGYITIGDYTFGRQKPVDFSKINEQKKAVVLSFSIGIRSFLLVADHPSKKSMCQDCFPLYYSYINNRLVLLYDVNAKWINGDLYTNDSKRIIASLVENTLIDVLKPDFPFKKFDNSTYIISEEERATMQRKQLFEKADGALNMGKTYYMFNDGTEQYRYYQTLK